MWRFFKPKRAAFRVALLAMAGLLIAGVSFEQIGQRRDRQRYPQIGRSLNIGGRTLNLYCSGEGAPVVVFDTYGHMAGYSWSAVQHEVARFTRACWYDRAAYGWSDSAPMPRTFQSVAEDLHALLGAAAEAPPYVLVGAGDAALHIRVFHGLYPHDVMGVVMANANDVDDPQLEVPDSEKGPWAKHFGAFAPRLRSAACVIFPVLAKVGLLRLAAAFQGLRSTPSFDLTMDQQAELDFLSDNPTAQQGSELCSRDTSMEQVRKTGNLGNIPLIVLASSKPLPTTASPQRVLAAARRQQQIERIQVDMANLSTRGRLVVSGRDVPGSAIIGAIRNVIGTSMQERQ